MTAPDIDDLSSLGGVKVNFAPLEDATTDLDADQDNQARCDTAMMTHSAIRAWTSVTLAATTGAMAIVSHDALWGNASGVKPAPAHGSTGVFTITWPSSVNDELGVAHTTNLRGAWVNVRGSTFYHATAEITAGNVVTVRVYNTSHAANDAVGVTVDVFAL